MWPRLGRLSSRRLGAAGAGQRGTAATQDVSAAIPPAIDLYAERIDSGLLADREVPRRQRHTARRIWQRLVTEHGATLAEVTMSRHVARRRVELSLDHVEVALPQTHPPGAEAEVDFAEVHARIAGGSTSCGCS